MDKRFFRILIVLAFAGTVSASAASPFTETFSNDGDEEGWAAAFGGATFSIAQDPVRDVLTFSGSPNFSNDVIAADSASSGGAFVGDFSAISPASLNFDFYLDPNRADLAGLSLDLVNFSTNDEWTFDLALAAAGSVTGYSISLSSSAGWVQVAGSNDFQYIVQNTESLGFLLTENTVDPSGAGVAGYVDNVALVPEASTWLLVLAAGGLFLGHRWKQSRV